MQYFKGNETLTALVSNLESTQNLLQIFLALLLRGGFILVQLGSIPIENISLILLQNIVDLAVSIISFSSIGFILAFGEKSQNGIVGYGSILSTHSHYINYAIKGLVASIIGSSIKTTLLSGRLHFICYFLSTFWYCGIYQPILMHWHWNENGWIHRLLFLNNKTYLQDNGGNLIIHLSSSVAGFAGTLLLGRRILRLSDLDFSTIDNKSCRYSFLGHIFIISGLIGFNFITCFKELKGNTYSVIALINSLIAVGAGFLTVILLQCFTIKNDFNQWSPLKSAQGAISGFIIIANGVFVYCPFVSFLIAILGALLYHFVSFIIYRSSLEDNCNVISIYLLPGFLGAALPPLFSNSKSWGTNTDAKLRLLYFAGHLLISLIVLVFIFSSFMSLFFILNALGVFRNKFEKLNHKRSENIADQIKSKCFLKRIFNNFDFSLFAFKFSNGKRNVIDAQNPENDSFKIAPKNVGVDI